MVANQDVLLHTTLRVLEDFAFVFAEPASEPRALPPEALTVSIPFTGDAEGTLTLTVTKELLTDMARDLLGQEPGAQVSASDEHATLAELSNVLLGVLLERRFGSARACHVGLPVVGAHAVDDPGSVFGLETVTLRDPMGRAMSVELLTQAT
jgi:hypothetical protein